MECMMDWTIHVYIIYMYIVQPIMHYIYNKN